MDEVYLVTAWSPDGLEEVISIAASEDRALRDATIWFDSFCGAKWPTWNDVEIERRCVNE
mgnify:FL=1